MRPGRISKALAAAAALIGTGGLHGPRRPPTETPTPTATAGGNVTVLEAAPFTSFNASGVTGKTPTNTRIDAATHSGFNSVDTELKIVKNEKFGKYEKVKDHPLTIKYTINDGVQWSDGAPVTADDLFLQWAARSGYFNDATLDKSFAVVKGNAYFHAAGDNSGLSRTEMPVVGDGAVPDPHVHHPVLRLGDRAGLHRGRPRPHCGSPFRPGGRTALTFSCRPCPRAIRRNPSPPTRPAQGG